MVFFIDLTITLFKTGGSKNKQFSATGYFFITSVFTSVSKPNFAISSQRSARIELTGRAIFLFSVKLTPSRLKIFALSAFSSLFLLGSDAVGNNVLCAALAVMLVVQCSEYQPMSLLLAVLAEGWYPALLGYYFGGNDLAPLPLYYEELSAVVC